MKTYRRAGEPASVIVGSSSALADALKASAALARKVYDDTKRFEALYGKADADWFMTWGREPYLTGHADDLAKCQASAINCAKECMLGCKRLIGEKNAC